MKRRFFLNGETYRLQVMACHGTRPWRLEWLVAKAKVSKRWASESDLSCVRAKCLHSGFATQSLSESITGRIRRAYEATFDSTEPWCVCSLTQWHRPDWSSDWWFAVISYDCQTIVYRWLEIVSSYWSSHLSFSERCNTFFSERWEKQMCYSELVTLSKWVSNSTG